MISKALLADELLSAIRNREINRGWSNDNGTDKYCLGFLIGTLDTLIKKYPSVEEDIRGHLKFIHESENAANIIQEPFGVE